MEIRSNTQRSRSASPKVGLIWSASDRAMERGGRARTNKVWWNSSEGGGRQPRYVSCTTTHEQGRLEPHIDLQRVWLNEVIWIAFQERQQQPDRNFVGI